MSRKLNLKKPKSLKTWLVPRLRRISIYWRGRNEAYHDARSEVNVGKFKNGKPKKKVLFECAHCNDFFDRKEVQADHIEDIAHVNGFTNWEDYITKLFCEKDGFQILCLDCHFMKSEYERSLRDTRDAEKD